VNDQVTQSEATKVDALEVDETAIALLIAMPGVISQATRHNVLKSVAVAIPNLKISVLILDGGTKINVLKASDAKTLSEILGTEAQ
jgi:hypothetical protein